MLSRSSLTVLLAGSVMLAGLPAASGPDPAFVSTFAGAAPVGSVLPLADGGALVAGSFDRFDGVARPRFVRLDAAGAVLPFQASSGAQPVPPSQLQEVGDGSVLLAGEFTSYDGQATFGLVRVDLATGATLETFPAGGGQFRYFLPGDGHIYRTRSDAQPTVWPLQRLLPDRQPDPTFVCSTDRLRNVLAGPGGTLVLRESPNGLPERLRRVLPNGSADSSFPVQSFPRPITVSALPDGRFLLAEAGTLTIPTQITRRLASDGTADPTFTAFQLDPYFLLLQLLGAPDGSAILGGFSYGYSASNPLPYDYGALRVAPNGSVSVLATAFAEGRPRELRFAADNQGRVWAWGAFVGYNGFAAGGLVRLAADLSPIPEKRFFASQQIGVAQLQALAPARQAGTFVGGDFVLCGGQTVGHFARLDASGQPLGPVASFDGPVNGMAPGPNGRLLVWGDFRAVDGIRSARVALLLPNGQRDPAFTSALNPVEVGQVVASFDPQGRVVIGGDFYSIGGLPRIAVARLLASGALDPSFDAGLTFASSGGPDVRVIRVAADGRIYVGGGTDEYFNAALQPGTARPLDGGPRSTSIARFLPDGAPDPSFVSPIYRHSQYDEEVYDLHIEGDGSVYIAGSLQLFRIAAGTLVRQEFLARLLPGGSLDRAVVSDLITTDGTSITTSLIPTEGGRFWLFTNQTEGQGKNPEVLRVFWNGRRDPTWGGTGSVVARGPLARRTDGRLVFAGSAGGSTAVFLAADDDAGAPSIAAQPAPVRANSGQPAVLRASATGGPGLVFTWFRNGQPIEGGADGRLTLPPVTAAELGSYHAVATNAAGSATTDTVHVTLNTPPTLTLPGPQTVPARAGSIIDAPIAFSDAETEVDLRVWGVPLGTAGNIGIVGLSFAPGTPVRLQVPALSPVAAPWQYRLVVRAEDQDGASVTREVTVQLRDQSYAEWAQDYFTPGELADPQVGGLEADPNRDGVSNFLAYVFGLDPRAPGSFTAAALPRLQPDGTGGFQLTYRAPDLPVGSAQVDVLGSADLQSWHPVAPDIQSRTLLPDGRTVVIVARVPLGSGPFFRVRAMGP